MGTLTDRGRTWVKAVIEPPSRALLRLGVSPDVVTLTGAAITSAAALWFLPRGDFLAALVIAGAFLFTDSLDGTMARLSERMSPWGAFLDSTCDRVTDAAIAVAFVLYYVQQDSDVMVAVALAALVGTQLVPYARARAEGLGLRADVGIAERSERLAVLGVAALVAQVWDPVAIDVGLWLLLILTWFTLLQRAVFVRAQTQSQRRS